MMRTRRKRRTRSRRKWFGYGIGQRERGERVRTCADVWANGHCVRVTEMLISRKCSWRCTLGPAAPVHRNLEDMLDLTFNHDCSSYFADCWSLVDNADGHALRSNNESHLQLIKNPRLSSDAHGRLWNSIDRDSHPVRSAQGRPDALRMGKRFLRQSNVLALTMYSSTEEPHHFWDTMMMPGRTVVHEDYFIQDGRQ